MQTNFNPEIYKIKQILSLDVALGDYVFLKEGYSKQGTLHKYNQLGKIIRIADTRTFGTLAQYRKIQNLSRSDLNLDLTSKENFLFGVLVGGEDIQAWTRNLDFSYSI